MPQLNQVFGVSTQIPEYTYVDRSGLDNRFRYSLQRDAHIVLHGGSKQGKTVLRRKNLAEERSIVVQCRATTTCVDIYKQVLGRLGIGVPTSFTESTSRATEMKAKGGVSIPLFKLGAEAGRTNEAESVEARESVGVTAENLHFVSEQVLKSGARVVIEDFHYMPEDEKRTLAFDLKALWDLHTFFIIVGVWAEQNLLAYYNGDLSGRIDEIDVQWTNEELQQVLTKGETALNIQFASEIKDAMIFDATQNVGLLQRIAEKFCIYCGVFETVSDRLLPLTLGDVEALNKCRAEICSEEAQRYRQFGDALSRGFKSNEESELKVYQNTARVCMEATDEELRNGLHYDTVYDRVHRLNARVRRSDFTAALQRLNRLQQDRQISPLVLSYNEKSRYVQLVDRELLFYRRYGNPVWPWNEEENEVQELAGPTQ